MDQLWVVLLRGINVGGRNIVKMAPLRDALNANGFKDVATYIQSGNIVLRMSSDAAAITDRIDAILQRDFGVSARILTLPTGTVTDALEHMPYAPEAPKHVMVYFLFGAATPDTDQMMALASATEEFTITDRFVYLHAPDGIGRSKLAEKMEKLLGTSATARNLATVAKLVEMVSAKEG